jgi:uncharacterized protein (TIGR02001 family)
MPNPKLIFSTVCFFVGLLYFDYVQADWHGELNFRSDYIYRGYSKSRGTPVLQADIHYQSISNLFAGVGLSQASFDGYSTTEMEIKPYVGLSQSIDRDWRFDVQAGAYFYDAKVFGHTANYVEFSVALNYQDWLGARFFVAPDAYERYALVKDYELYFRYPLSDACLFSTGLGYAEAKSLIGHDYFYWNSGFSWFLTENVALDLRYVDVNLDDYPKLIYSRYYPTAFYPRLMDNKFLFSISYGF